MTTRMSSQLEGNLHKTRIETSLRRRQVNRSRVENSHCGNLSARREKTSDRARKRNTLSKRQNDETRKKGVTRKLKMSLPVGLGSGRTRRMRRRLQSIS